MKAALAAPTRLRCEFLTDPLGIEARRPRLAWWVSDPRRGARQSACHVLVASSREALDRDEGDVWDSGRLESAEPRLDYGGLELRSRQRCFWKVRTYDADAEPSPWSEPARWEMGLLDPGEWGAEWIGRAAGQWPAPPAHLRREFTAQGPVRRARLYATALGIYELRLNGRKVGEHVFPPGWTDYKVRVMYQAYDVSGLVREGENTLGALVADGWYCGRIGFGADSEPVGEPPPRLLARLEVECEDGSTLHLVTDASWRASTGPVLSAGFYDGERYDARREMPGWDEPGFDDSAWDEAAPFDDPGIERNAQHDPPIRVTEELAPVGLREQEPGVWVYDMGQNMVGVCRLRACGPAGTEVKLRHAEVLNPDGSLCTENLRRAEATDRYVLRGEGEEVFTPRFTYHGFRYVEVTGHPGEPAPDDLTGLVLHTDCEPTGRFTCSSEMVNRLYRNIAWAQRGNMHSVLTDCPQRDERLGWMGDAQIFARTACFNMDMAAMLEKFVRDMRDEQTPEGAFPDVCPYVSAGGVLPPAGAPAWMDAGVIVPWTAYLCYADRRLLARHFDAMARYVDYVAEHNPDGIWENARGNDYGDWVPAGQQTDKTMFATLHFFYCALLTAKAAEALGRDEERDRFDALAAKVRDAFNARYLNGGSYEGGTQTVNALALAFGVVPEGHRESVAADLAADIESRGGHLATGFGGTQWLLPALCETGYDALAHRLLLNRDFPSWGYMVEKGATTIWELWNSDTEGPGMNSRNHFAYGSVGEWMFRYLAGIDTAEDGPGYAHALVRPHPAPGAGGLSEARASYDSVRGRIETAWRLSDGGLEVDAVIPPASRATVSLPADSPEAVSEGGRPLAEAAGVTDVRYEGGRVVFEAAAGSYAFTVEGA